MTKLTYPRVERRILCTISKTLRCCSSMLQRLELLRRLSDRVLLLEWLWSCSPAGAAPPSSSELFSWLTPTV